MSKSPKRSRRGSLLFPLGVITERIEHRDGKVDQIERESAKRLSRLELDLAQKLHLLGCTEGLVEISDRAEDPSGRIALVAAERVI